MPQANYPAKINRANTEIVLTHNNNINGKYVFGSLKWNAAMPMLIQRWWYLYYGEMSWNKMKQKCAYVHYIVMEVFFKPFQMRTNWWRNFLENSSICNSNLWIQKCRGVKILSCPYLRCKNHYSKENNVVMCLSKGININFKTWMVLLRVDDSIIYQIVFGSVSINQYFIWFSSRENIYNNNWRIFLQEKIIRL